MLSAPSSSPGKMGVSLRNGGYLGLHRSNSTASVAIPFGPSGLSPRRHYSEGTGVAPYKGDCCGHQWNQVEINEMALNMGKGDLRGLSPGPATPAPSPAPFSPTPGRPAPPLAPAAPAAVGYRCFGSVPAAPQRRAAQRVCPLGLRHRGGRRLLPARSSRMGAPRNPRPGGCTGVSGWTREGLGTPVHGQSSLDHGNHGPLQRLHREGSGPGESSSPLHPAATRGEAGTASRFLTAGPGAGTSSAAAAARTTTHSSVLYSPPN